MQLAEEKRKLNVLVVGDRGQLGSCLKQFLQEVSKQEESIFGDIIGADYPEVDISKPRSLEELVGKITHGLHSKIHVVVNCAAITDTTKIECDDAARDRSYAVNALGPKCLAEICVRYHMKLVHISTDYVFSEKSKNDGFENSKLVQEFPVNTYGLHKLLGEKMIELAFAARPQDFMILRTSWLYGNSEASFPVKLLKTCLEKKREVKVVDDCFGRPTSVQYLARFITSAIKNNAHGKIDAQSTAAPISRFEFANLILERWREHAGKSSDPEVKALAMDDAILTPCKSSDFKTVMRHPREMPYLAEKTSTTTPDQAISEIELQAIVNGTKAKSLPNEMYAQWLAQFGGYEMLERFLKEFKRNIEK